METVSKFGAVKMMTLLKTSRIMTVIKVLVY